ncbi:MAG: protoporphyrinogen oxidase [Acidobacteriota bacterium]|nr:protoporphyrinogen oxidase [Acidobacteriota bacterium]
MTSHTSGPVRTVVIGGGITGLAAAHRLIELAAERGVEPSVLLVESGPRVGGQIRTERHDRYLLECGPDTLVTSKPAGVSLCERLGLGGEIAGVESQRHGVQILHDGRLIRLPQGLAMLVPAGLPAVFRSPVFSWSGKMRMAAERYVPERPESVRDESLTSFVTRRFGPEVAERVAEPIIASLYTADANRLGLGTAMPRLLEMERRYGSITRAFQIARRKHKQIAQGKHTGTYAQAAYLRGGFETIVERLVERIGTDRVRTGAPVGSIARDAATASWKVRFADGTAVDAESVLLTCPAHAAANLLDELDRDLRSDLSRLDYATCATVNLVYRREDIELPDDSFGFFVPRNEPVPILACSFVSKKFEGRVPDDSVLLRAFVGGARNPEQLEADDASIERRTHDALTGVLEIRQPPVFVSTSRMERSMPQYEVGYTDAIDSIRARLTRHPGLFVAGTALGAFGLPDCIASGESAAGEAIAFALGTATTAEVAHR